MAKQTREAEETAENMRLQMREAKKENEASSSGSNVSGVPQMPKAYPTLSSLQSMGPPYVPAALAAANPPASIPSLSSLAASMSTGAPSQGLTSYVDTWSTLPGTRSAMPPTSTPQPHAAQPTYVHMHNHIMLLHTS